MHKAEQVYRVAEMSIKICRRRAVFLLFAVTLFAITFP
jgi:hypothetical protein